MLESGCVSVFAEGRACTALAATPLSDTTVGDDSRSLFEAEDSSEALSIVATGAILLTGDVDETALIGNCKVVWLLFGFAKRSWRNLLCGRSIRW
jgi:hypothetical protein